MNVQVPRSAGVMCSQCCSKVTSKARSLPLASNSILFTVNVPERSPHARPAPLTDRPGAASLNG